MTDIVSLDHILPLVRKPGRYIGGELHAAHSSWDEAAVRFVLVFPDLYEIGMSHQGLQILYHILNRQENVLAERCYAPDLDMEEELRRHELPIFSIESRRPLDRFDVIAFTLPYELCYTNILTVLDLAGVPLRAGQRTEAFPLVVGGGSCCMNPEPVADFFDAIVLGDGEETILDIAAVVEEAKNSGYGRREILSRLAAVDGVYVPSFFAPQYSGAELTAIRPLKPGYETVRRRVIPRLPVPDHLEPPLVPVVKPVHDRLGLEIARGCTRGCRFCQAGITYRPVRERSVDEILRAAEQGIESSGFDELALLSLSTGDFSCLPELTTRLMDRFADSYVSVSMPSMRVGTLTPEIMEQIKRVRKTGFTVAPEAGSDRLREVINKGITEEDLLATCRNAFAMGWNLIKFYFMIGLPTETWEDVESIMDLAGKARLQAGRGTGRAQVNVSVGTFVPKPHTPFQWERQLSLAESAERIDRLKKLLPRRGMKLKWQDPRQSFMEGVFSRGDRRLSRLIECAWRSGSRLDAWSEHYDLEHWRQAALDSDIDLAPYLEARDRGKPLPWDHLDSGVDRAFLELEYRRAMERIYTPDCRTSGCQQCGLCDFKTLRPRLNKSQAASPAADSGRSRPAAGPGREPVGNVVCRVRVHYTRLGDSRFLGHLEVLQLIFRALSRASIPVLFSQGYNPSPRISFSQALPVGVESEVEYFDMDLAEPPRNLGGMAGSLSEQLPPGMTVRSMELVRKRDADGIVTSYEVVLVRPLSREQLDNISRFLSLKSFPITRIRKGRQRELDIRPLVQSLNAGGSSLDFELITYNSQAGVNPREVLELVVQLPENERLLARVKKVGITDLLRA